MSVAREPVVVCVLGMHRSGTSLLARLLNLGGVALGPQGRLAPAAADNPRGFWEHAGLREINEELLHAFGGSWMDPPELPEGWSRDPRVAPVLEQARGQIARDFAGAALWGFKDPRLSLTVEFWRRVLPGRIAWIVALRNPLEVCDSLKRRNGLPSVLAEDLWCAYTRASLLATRPDERALVHYERLLEDPGGEIARLIAELRLPVPPPGAEARAAMREESTAALRHHRHDMAEVARREDLRPDTRELYRRLWNGEPPAPLQDPAEGDRSGFRRAFVGLRGEVARLVDELSDRERRAGEAELRHDREVAEWRDEALRLRHENELLKKRAEYRFGERLRRAWRRLRRSGEGA